MKISIAVFLPLALNMFSFSVIAEQAPPTYEQMSEVKEYLFVQNASSGSVNNGRLTMTTSAPIIFFTDRPYRIFGHTTVKHFIDSWNAGADSFSEDPPNAVLSILGEEVASFGVVLSAPRLAEDGTVSYQVEVDQGELPAQFGQASLFIDNEAWAAVGGLFVGHRMARRQEAARAVAYTEGANATAAQNANTYYHATAAPAPKSTETPEQQLTELQALLDKGLINQDDYNKKKQQILQQIWAVQWPSAGEYGAT